MNLHNGRLNRAEAPFWVRLLVAAFIIACLGLIVGSGDAVVQLVRWAAS